MVVLSVGVAIGIGLLFGGMAAAAPLGPGWSIRSVAQPTKLSSTNNEACEKSGGGSGSQACDSYTLIVTNVGSRPSVGGLPVTISDTLPHGVHALSISGENPRTEASLECSVALLQCVTENVLAGETLVVSIHVIVDREDEEHQPVEELENEAAITGGGAPAVATTERTALGSTPAPFGIEDFALRTFDADGLPSAQAGSHPLTLLTSLYFTTENTGRLESVFYRPSEDVKDVIVDLPPGLVGNPETIPRCPIHALLQNSGITACPLASRVGTIVFDASPGTFRVSEGGPGSETTAIYNMEPEPGFPAEFGFTYLGKGVLMYASAVRIGGQLRLRVTAPGIPKLETIGVTLLFFGDPEQHFEEVASPTPFFTNPVDCAAGPLSATAEVDTWEHPGFYHIAESITYPKLTDCNMLQFQPTLNVKPEITQADEPSGYTFEVQSRQNESFAAPATPELKNATVTLPAGVSISPAAADGLRGCVATGPEGINIGSGETAATGRDEGNPEATELGAGHLGGDGSPYDDGLYHTAPGHCPLASTIGTVEVETPLLKSPLEGHVYVALPQCGGSGQSPCTEADALNGRLFGAYLEVSGSGAIVKLAGNVSINPVTGQITASFRENPQVPFSAFRLSFHGGPRAPFANPQTCGAATTSGNFTAWSSPATLDTTALSAFNVDWDGVGGACPATLPLAPSMIAETTNPTAGAFSPFTFTLSRGDRQQYLSQLSVTTPPGLLGMLSSVPLCGEPQAAEGTCPETSQIGTTNVAAGPGSHPLWVSGRVYLTGPYNGAPFGLSIVVPADAGPFHLGNVVVRSAITADQHTSALTITSAPLPQVIDGVPLRVQTVNVTVNRPDFMFNPTNCAVKQIDATVAGAQYALVHVSNSFAASGCRNLPFSPKFTASSSARTSKKYGASFDVKVLYKPGQANIRSVSVKLPKQLPARLTTIQQACLAATFAANPATCPAGSLIGIAKARTPVLPVPLEGPAYLVSHGGAAFPDVVLVLQGEGVRIDLTGNVNISKGITSSTFANVPDAPITSFELKLPLGTHSALAANGYLCGTPLTMPTTLTAQNGLQVKQNTKIAIVGCPKVKKKKAKKAALRSPRGDTRSGR
jgi:hypothetical protein